MNSKALIQKLLSAVSLVVCAVMGWLSLGATHSVAQSPYSLISMADEWRCNFGGTNLGSAWRPPSYNDSNWITARGVFAILTNPNDTLVASQTNTVLPLTNGNNQFIVTHYFRTRFTLTNDPFQVALVMTNLIDDGAVFYLNGTEFRRFNMAASPTPVTYVSGAASSIDASYITSTIPANLLVRGENVLAAELHNVNSASKDAVFGCAVSVVYPDPTPITITNQPASQTVPEGTTVTFSVAAVGTPRAHQWFKNGEPITGATGTILTITNALLQDGGEYWVTISNSISFVESAHATLVIGADTNGPVLIAAEQISATEILITFSEPILGVTATNLGNYMVTNLGGALLPDYFARLENGTNVYLTTQPALANTNYVVIVNEVRDASLHTNRIAANSMIPVARWISLLDEYSFYYFYNPFVSQIPPAPWDEDPDLGASWRLPEYVVNADTNDFWGNNDLNRGAFFYGPTALPADKGTELASSMAPIVYFRASVNLPGSPAGLEVTLEHLMQDGGIVYMNGAEALRYNLPTGIIDWATRASYRTNPVWRIGLNAKSIVLNPGENTICAELHSAQVPQTNMAFALRLKARITSIASGPILITAQPASQKVPENAPVTFSFMAAGPARFQWYMNGSPIPGATNAFYQIPTTPLSMNGAQFSVHAWNDASSVMSTNATLNVVADTNGPVLLGANAVGSGQILLNFSEALDPASATNLGNYVLTNGSGVDLPIFSATVTNGTNVLLNVGAGAGSKPYVVVLQKISDRAEAANTVQINTAAMVGLKLSIPITAVWKYDVSGMNLGTAWRELGYNDSSWPEGAGLLYNETSPLPAPKSTLLPTISPVTGTYITTFYFRYPFSLATGTTNALVTLRHMIDDGAAFYANGREFHRFNMASGNIIASTYANVSVDNADYAGPLTVSITNITAGENVLAAEVHQVNGSSNDICYGAEISITAPSLVIPPPAILPRPVLALARTNNQMRLSWAGFGFTLQKTTNLQGASTIWQNVTGMSPHLVSPSEGASFYRLKSN